MSAPTHEPMVLIAAADLLFASRTLTTLVDSGALPPIDRALVQIVINLLARNEVMSAPYKVERPARANRVLTSQPEETGV